MDTTAIIIEEEPTFKTSYSREEIMRMVDGTWDSDSNLYARPYEEVPCTKVETEPLPLLEIRNQELIEIVSEIIEKTVSGGFSISPDSLISHGIYFHINFYRDRRLQTRPIVMQIEVHSNYYLGSNYEYIKRNHPDSNVFCCYFQGFLGIMTFSDSTIEKSIKPFFSETKKSVKMHLYKKLQQKIEFDINSANDRDVHSTNYGLYRRYKLSGKNWIEYY